MHSNKETAIKKKKVEKNVFLVLVSKFFCFFGAFGSCFYSLASTIFAIEAFFLTDSMPPTQPSFEA